MNKECMAQAQGHGRRSGQDDSLVNLSKSLSWILRHHAEKEGLTISDDGFVAVNDILSHKSFCGKYSLDDIKLVVDTNNKQRFTLQQSVDGKLVIKANQGHSIPTLHKLDLIPILDKCEAPVVIHGTYLKNWEKIKAQGLSRMHRNHIHFAVGEPGDSEVISGMRSSCQMFIHIDIERALKGLNGLKFYRSPNNVILSPGNVEGFIKPIYFSRVSRRSS